MNNSIDKKLLEILREIHQEMQDPKNWPHYGICYEIRRILKSQEFSYSDMYDIKYLFDRISTLWPKYSGNIKYPVPHINKYEDKIEKAREIFYFGTHRNEANAFMWDRKRSGYASLRWELLIWVINYLEKDLILKSLKEIHLEMQDPKNWKDAGICNILDSKIEITDFRCISTLFTTWPKSQGDGFPVPHPSLSAYEAFLKIDKKEEFWDRSNYGYAKNRWELLEFMIEQLEKDLNK